MSIRTRVFDGTSLVANGGVGGTWVDPFLVAGGIGVARPSAAGMVGAGVYQGRPWPTAAAETKSGVTLNTGTRVYTVSANTTVEDAVFQGFVNLGTGATLVNCLISGPPSYSTNSRALVQGPTGGSTRATMMFCTVDPQVASPYIDAVTAVNMYVTRCDLKNTTDGIRAFNQSGALNSLIEATYIHDLAQFAPDPAGNRSETHNDGSQMQGSSITNLSANDLVFDGCEINARHSTTKGTIPPYRTQISALMLTPNVGQIRMTFKRGWLLGGTVCVNIMATNSGGILVLQDTKFERPNWPGNDGRDPDAAIGRTSASAITLTMSNLTYIDNGADVNVTIL